VASFGCSKYAFIRHDSINKTTKPNYKTRGFDYHQNKYQRELFSLEGKELSNFEMTAEITTYLIVKLQ
jgi:hypothetical protein